MFSNPRNDGDGYKSGETWFIFEWLIIRINTKFYREVWRKWRKNTMPLLSFLLNRESLSKLFWKRCHRFTENLVLEKLQLTGAKAGSRLKTQSGNTTFKSWRGYKILLKKWGKENWKVVVSRQSQVHKNQLLFYIMFPKMKKQLQRNLQHFLWRYKNIEKEKIFHFDYLFFPLIPRLKNVPSYIQIQIKEIKWREIWRLIVK